MKKFSEIREARRKGMPEGEHVFDKKVNKVVVMVHKVGKEFITYIDGDKLDSYRTQKQAERMGISFAKEM